MKYQSCLATQFRLRGFSMYAGLQCGRVDAVGFGSHVTKHVPPHKPPQEPDLD